MRILALLLLSVASLTAQPLTLDDQVFLANSSGLKRGLVSYWPLNEASGTRYDYGPGKNHLTSNNSVGQAAGKVGNGATFVSASSQSLSISPAPSSLQAGDVDFTITGWFNLSSYPTTGKLFAIIAQDNNTSGQEQYALYAAQASAANKSLFVVFKATDVPVVVTSTDAPSTNVWNFIVAWHNSADNTVNLQLNNSAIFSTSYTGNLQAPTANTVYIGQRQYSGFPEWLNGAMDELGFWKRVLTAEERTQLYKSGLGTTFPRFSYIEDFSPDKWQPFGSAVQGWNRASLKVARKLDGRLYLEQEAVSWDRILTKRERELLYNVQLAFSE